jgi:hypothetical protein
MFGEISSNKIFLLVVLRDKVLSISKTLSVVSFPSCLAFGKQNQYIPRFDVNFLVVDYNMNQYYFLFSY